MAVGNTTPPTASELIQYLDVRLKITIDHYTYYSKFHTDTRVVENEIRMLEGLKKLAIEKQNSE